MVFTCLDTKEQNKENCRLAFRGEYYRDDKQIIISTGTKNGFQTFGLSSNFDLDVNEKNMFRLEVKMLHSKMIYF